MFAALVSILVLPYSDIGRTKGLQFRPLSKLIFFMFVANFLLLLQLGAKHVESPFIELGQISTAFYFAYFFLLVPSVSILENTLLDIKTYALNNKKKDCVVYGIHFDCKSNVQGSTPCIVY